MRGNVFKNMFLCGLGLMILAVFAAVFLSSAGAAAGHSDTPAASVPEKTATPPVKTAAAPKTCWDYGTEAGLNMDYLVMKNCSGTFDTYRNRTGKWCLCQREDGMIQTWNILNGDTCATYNDGGAWIWEMCSWETSAHQFSERNISAYLFP